MYSIFNSLTSSPLCLLGWAGKTQKRQVSLTKFSTNSACKQETSHTHTHKVNKLTDGVNDPLLLGDVRDKYILDPKCSNYKKTNLR